MRNDKLFHLISSLSKPEKGYFRKFCKIHSSDSEKNYLDLFDCIDHMEVYDEKELKAAFAHTKWINHLPALKTYLFHQILKSLEAMQHTSVKDEDKMLVQSRMLIQRGLFDEALKMLRKIQAAAEENENYYALLGALNRESVLIKSLTGSHDLHRQLKRIRSHRQEVLQILGDLLHMQDVTDELHEIYFNKGAIREHDLMSHIEEMIDDEFIRRIESSKSINYKRVGYNALHLYYEMKLDANNVFLYAQKQFDLSVRHSEFYNKHLLRTYIYHYNYLHGCIINERFDLFEANIGHFEHLEIDHNYGRNQKFFMLYHLYFSYMLESAKYSKLYDFMPAFEKGYRLYSRTISYYNRIHLLLQLAHLLYLNGETDRAIDWNNKALEMQKKVKREDYKTTVRVQDLVLHYELGSKRLLSSKILSAQRNLAPKSIFYLTERCIVSYMGKLIKADDRKEEISVLNKFEAALELIYKAHDIERLFLHSFDIIDWIRKKKAGQ